MRTGVFAICLWLLTAPLCEAYSPSLAKTVEISKLDAAGGISSRRAWLSTSSAATASLLLSPKIANAAGKIDLTVFDDPKRDFSVAVPADWTFSKQVLRDRRELLLWQDPSDTSTAIFIAYTPVRDDFTSLGSFGTVDQVAAQTILPKGTLMSETETDQSAVMLSAVQAKQAYFFDYRQTVPPSTLTHFRTIFALQQGATGGAGAVLVTITAQAPEARYSEGLKNIYEDIINSYGKSSNAAA